MGRRATYMYGMHHWPVWGTDRVLEMLRAADREEVAAELTEILRKE